MRPARMLSQRLTRSLAVFGVLCASSALAQIDLKIQPRMGQPVDGLTATQLNRFLAGKVVFETPLGVPTGLGPIFNQGACGTCHGQPAGGGAGSIVVTRFGKAGVGPVPFDPLANLGGSLLQALTTSPACQEVIPPEATVVAQRLTNSTFGSGLVEAIPDASILARATNPPANVSGIAHMVGAFEDPPNAPLRVGRFGWKAQVATVLTFSADASQNELGLTNRFLPQENAPNGNLALLATCDPTPDPEDGPDSEGFHMIDRMTDFQRYLAAPPQTPKSGMTGESLFVSIGCAACHVATPFQTGTVGEAALSQQLIKPYSDYLLHDMGSLGDGIVQGAGTEREMRTPSLWGVRARDSLLHDARATGGTFTQNIETSIQWHDGEGAPSRAAYQALSAADRAHVIAFLDSLGRAEFDVEGDNDIDEVDWFLIDFSNWVTGPVPANPSTPDDPAAVADLDRDGDFDLIDFGMMQRAFTGQ